MSSYIDYDTPARHYRSFNSENLIKILTTTYFFFVSVVACRRADSSQVLLLHRLVRRVKPDQPDVRTTGIDSDPLT